MSVFRLKHGYRYGRQGMINLYHYVELLSGVGKAQNLAEAFIDLVIPAIQDIQHEDVEHLFVVAENLSVFSNDRYVIDFDNVTGQRPGDGMPTHDTMTFQLLVETNDTRMGRKAIGGVPESDFEKGEPFGNTITRLQTASEALATVFEEALGVDFWFPIVFRDNPIAFDTANLIQGSRFARVSTQNSRKSYTSSSISRSSEPADVVFVGQGDGTIAKSGNWLASPSYTSDLYPTVPPAFEFDDGSTSPASLPIVS